MEVQSRGLKWMATTDGEGRFFVSSLVAGVYDVKVDQDSLPAGYSADALGEAQRVTVEASAPGRAAFAARAFRSISGRVVMYDTKAGGYVPVDGAQVILGDPGGDHHDRSDGTLSVSRSGGGSLFGSGSIRRLARGAIRRPACGLNKCGLSGPRPRTASGRPGRSSVRPSPLFSGPSGASSPHRQGRRPRRFP